FSVRALLKARDPRILHEPLATLGDSLGLYRFSVSAGGAGPASGPPFDWMPDIGAHEFDQIKLIEVDPHGRCRRSEVFAADRLGDAVARLYERYADLLPDGPARVRAAATARAVVAMLGPGPTDRWRIELFAPGIERVDHPTVGLGSVP